MLLGMDGADHYGTSGANMTAGVYADAGLPPSTTRPRNGTHSFRATGTGGFENRRAIAQGAQSVFGLGLASFVDTLPSDDTSVYLQECRTAANAILCRLKLLPTGAIQLETGSIILPTVLATSDPGVITANEFNHVEAKYVFAGAAGACEVRRNGVTVIDATSVDIGAAASCAIFAYGVTAGIWGGSEMCVDDVFWWNDAGSFNNDFIGDRVVVFLNPNGDEAASDWTRNTGATDFSAIADLAPDGDTTYIEATTNGDTSEFALTNLDAEVVNIAGLCAYTNGKKTDAGDGSVTVSMLSADVGSPAAPAVDVGDEHAFGLNYGYFVDVFETDPATGALWTPSAVNAARVRLERTA